MRRGLCEETVEEDIDERSFARLFFFSSFFLAHSRKRVERAWRRERGREGRTKRRKDRDGNKGMSGGESGGSRPESTQP